MVCEMLGLMRRGRRKKQTASLIYLHSEIYIQIVKGECMKGDNEPLGHDVMTTK